MTTNHHGPYARREQAAAAAAPLYAAIRAVDPGGPMSEKIRANRRQAVLAHIDDVLRETGVVRSNYDIEIEDWLCMWEPETIQVILSWIEQAHHVGLRRGRTAAKFSIDDQVVTPDGPGRITGLGAGVVTADLDGQDRVRSYPDTFVKPHEGGA
jgi:hypothetical protein